MRRYQLYLHMYVHICIYRKVKKKREKCVCNIVVFVIKAQQICLIICWYVLISVRKRRNIYDFVCIFVSHRNNKYLHAHLCCFLQHSCLLTANAARWLAKCVSNAYTYAIATEIVGYASVSRRANLAHADIHMHVTVYIHINIY